MKKSKLMLVATALAGLMAVSTVQAEMISVKNIRGETQKVPHNPKRVVVLDFAAADSLAALGVQDRVVGLSLSTVPPKYLADEYNSDKLVNVGSLKEPNFERINELNPDLIIMGGRMEKLLGKLSEIAPVYYAGYDVKDVYHSMEQNVLAFGKIFDKEAQAKQKLADLAKKVSNLAEKAKGKTALMLLANESKISAFGEVSRFGHVFKRFGFTSADHSIKSSTHGMSVGFEYLLEKNPDYIFVVDRTAAVTEKKDNAKAVFNNDIVKRTKAAKAGHIVYLDAANWYFANGGLQSAENMVEELKATISH